MKVSWYIASHLTKDRRPLFSELMKRKLPAHVVPLQHKMQTGKSALQERSGEFWIDAALAGFSR